MTRDIDIIRKELRRSPEARYIHRLHGVLLVLLGTSTVKAGKLLGDPQRTVAHWVVQYKARGLAGLYEVAKPGRPQAVSLAQRKELSTILARPPKNAGLNGETWTNVLLLSLLRKRYGVLLSARQCSRLLIALTLKTKT